MNHYDNFSMTVFLVHYELHMTPFWGDQIFWNETMCSVLFFRLEIFVLVIHGFWKIANQRYQIHEIA